MIDTLPDLLEYLDDRGARYGIPGSEIHEAIPAAIRSDAKQSFDYMQMKDISHIQPLSKGGPPAGDNWILEDSDVNQARGAKEMTPEELEAAEADSDIDVAKLKNAALYGGALTMGAAVAEGALGVAAAGTAAAAEATFITTVVIPAVVVAGTLGGCGWLGYKLYKKLKR